MPGHTVLYLLFAIRIIFAPFVDYHHSFFPDDKESTTHSLTSLRSALQVARLFFHFCLHASMHFRHGTTTTQLPSSSILQYSIGTGWGLTIFCRQRAFIFCRAESPNVNKNIFCMQSPSLIYRQIGLFTVNSTVPNMILFEQF